MFIGYQNNIARYIKNTREELDTIPHVSFDKIEEVPFAEMYNGVIYTSEFELTRIKTKAVEETRAGLYAAQVDPLMAEYNRKKTFNLFAEGEEALLLSEIEVKVEEIKANNPYPVEEEEEVEEPAETEATVEDLSEESNNEVVELYSMEI